MKLLILLLFLLSAFLFFSYFLQLFFLSNKKMEKRMASYLLNGSGKKLDRKRMNVLLQIQLYKKSVKERVLSKQKNEKLEELLNRAGLAMKPEEYIIFQWILTALFGGVMYLLFSSWIMMVAGLGAGYLFPRWWVNKRVSKRLLKFNDGLPDMIMTIIGSLRAGFSFAQSLKTVSEESESPNKEEMETVLKEMQYGSNIEDALQMLKERMPSEDLDLLIQAVLIQKQVGGNLAAILETIVQTIRDRNKIQRQILTLTAQGRLSGIVIGLLPVALGIVIYLLQPAYISSFFNHPLGILMISIGIISGFVGFALIRKVTKIEV
ncbi:MAG TPA: type II secretion system F family protein [Bacilli bacterium]